MLIALLCGQVLLGVLILALGWQLRNSRTKDPQLENAGLLDFEMRLRAEMNESRRELQLLLRNQQGDFQNLLSQFRQEFLEQFHLQSQNIQNHFLRNQQQSEDLEHKNQEIQKILSQNLTEQAKQSNQQILQVLEQFSKLRESIHQHHQNQLENWNQFSTQSAQNHQEMLSLNQQSLDRVNLTMQNRLESLQNQNAQKLEEMRQTVDEKLQGTLEKRLSESFKQVGDRLEQVHKGLGEMQSLATGVGDLKKVLSNVKSRGIWGEIQLENLLEQCLNSEQFFKNISTGKSTERVDFAIKLPGNSDDPHEHLLLPIDAKFPMEDYQSLLDATERGQIEEIERFSKNLEVRIRAEAQSIASKYLNPPRTTDFAILFLPVEGLFAEVIRRNGLMESLQRDHKIIIAGPTTLWSILNSLQMGFKTLAIQKRSSEVWNTLSGVKTEWEKYGGMLDKVRRKIQEASNTMDEVSVRSRALGRKLKDVESLPNQSPMEDLEKLPSFESLGEMSEFGEFGANGNSEKGT
jgi:DNA recombination protein RmuC